jgi:hypothetical protein
LHADLNEMARRVIDGNHYVVAVTACEVHVAGRHPEYGPGVDIRLPADPAAA